MGDDESVGDVLTAIMIVALIGLFVRPRAGLKAIAIINGFSTLLQQSISNTYMAAGIAPHAPAGSSSGESGGKGKSGGTSGNPGTFNPYGSGGGSGGLGTQDMSSAGSSSRIYSA